MKESNIDFQMSKNCATGIPEGLRSITGLKIRVVNGYLEITTVPAGTILYLNPIAKRQFIEELKKC